MPYLKSHDVTQMYVPRVVAAAEALPQAPTLAVVLVGDDPASVSYVGHKQKFAAKIGCVVQLHTLPKIVTEADIAAKLAQLAEDKTVHGIILQLPLPQNLAPQALLDMIPALKDVDGLGVAQRTLLEGENPQALHPATPLGILRWIRFLDVVLTGKRVCIVGRSHLVGSPLATLCTQQGAEVITFSKENPIQPNILQTADIIVAAAGVPHLIQADWVKNDALVIDVGITRVEGKLLGDCAPEIQNKAILTAVPGGVGPLTVLSLFTNLVDAAYLQQGLPRPAYA